MRLFYLGAVNLEGDFEGLKKWRPSIKFGGLAFLLFCVACFAYGWLHDFHFWHAFADKGINSAIAHTIYYAVFAGPVVFAAATLFAKFGLKK